MESVGQTMAHRKQARQFDYEELVKQIVADPDVAAFIQSERLTPAEIKRSISKFNQYISERNRFLLGDKAYIAKGYKPILVKNEGYADVSYEETPELVEAQKQATINARLNLISLPASLKEASLAKVDLDDVGRYKAFELLTNFVADYPNYKKAIYLYGDFGVGKSYMMAALAHDLSEKRSVSTTLLHYPSFVLDVKNAISSGLVKEKIDEVKVAQVLILDDIGAEQSSPWMRDEILQVILQHRMQENLPAFFTSILILRIWNGILRHPKTEMKLGRLVVSWKRIKFLAEEVRLEGIADEWKRLI